MHTSYAYDAASRLSSLGQDLGGSAYDLSLTFGYNPAGQIVTNTRSNDAYAFGGSSNGTISSPSNGLNQLTSAGGAGIAKHVHRAMLENARQGFWNGSRPPYGCGVKIAERRGNKDKKMLVIDEAEARVVRMIFDMATGTESCPWV